MRKTQIYVPAATQLPSGRWRCRVTIGGKKPSYTADTKAEAEELARQAVAEYKAGVLVQKQSAQTVESCIKRFIEDRRSILSPSTIRGYQIILKNRFQTMLQRDIHSVTPQQWQAAVNAEARRLSPKTVRNSWGLLSSVIKDATGSAPAVRLPAIAKNLHPFLDDQQTKVLLAAVRDTDIEAAVLLGLHSLRCSEIIAISWGQIDAKRKTITVKGAMVMDEYSQLVLREQNKTTASQRTLPVIIPRLLELASGKPADERPAPFTPAKLYSSINRICKDNGLPEIGIHGLRHTFASLCYYAGLPEKAVMDMGGWNNPTVLREIYTHLSARQKNQYIDKLSSLFQD